MVSLLLLACGQNTAPYVTPDKPPPVIVNAAAVPAPTQLSCDSGTALTYRSFGASFIKKYCLSCHSSTSTGSQRQGSTAAANFDTAKDLQVWRGAILSRISGGSKMPPAGEVEANDLAAAKEWLGCGAPSSP